MKYRPRLNEEEYALITKHRALQKECELTGIPIDDVNHYWYKGKHFSLHVKNKGVTPEDKGVLLNSECYTQVQV